MQQTNKQRDERITRESQAHDNYQYGFTTGDSRHSFMQLKVDNTAHNKHSIIMVIMMENGDG